MSIRGICAAVTLRNTCWCQQTRFQCATAGCQPRPNTQKCSICSHGSHMSPCPYPQHSATSASTSCRTPSLWSRQCRPAHVSTGKRTRCSQQHAAAFVRSCHRIWRPRTLFSAGRSLRGPRLHAACRQRVSILWRLQLWGRSMLMSFLVKTY